MREDSELSALQCCLLCGRTLTDRAAHDALEERILAAIRAEHPDWGGEGERCEQCVARYRELINGRAARYEQPPVPEPRRWRKWARRLFHQTDVAPSGLKLQ